jgi:hypothetical protein
MKAPTQEGFALDPWDEAREALDQAGRRAVAGAAALAAGNAMLMAALGMHPFPDALVQLSVGTIAMGLHGWAAWTILSLMRAWGRASGWLAMGAVGVLRREAGRAKARLGAQG